MGREPRQTADADQGADTAKLCHDLRQYVAAGLILAGVQQMAGLDAETRRRFETIAHVFEGIKSVLDEQAREHERAVPVDLGAVAEESVAFTRLVSMAPIDMFLAGSVKARANPSLLERALLNVLSNATRAAGVGGRVSVETGCSGNDAWVEVRDDGAGFGRIPAVTGLGMSIVEAAVRSAGGRLEIYSGPGPGTRVRLRLPRAW